MKKIMGFAFAMIFILSSFAPASAKGKASEVLVSIAAPSTAVAGTSYEIFLTANKLGWKLGEQKLLLEFPSSIVKTAICRDSSWGWRSKDGSKNTLHYEWKFKLSLLWPMAQLNCTVTLRAGLAVGQVKYLSLFDKKAEIFMGRYSISIIKPKLNWSSISPESVKMGEVPFDVVIVAKNESASDLPVDMNLYVYFDRGATNGHVRYEVPTSGEIDNFKADGYGATMHWSGIVKARQTAYFVVHLESTKASWSFPGSYQLFRIFGEDGTYQSEITKIRLE